MPACSCAHTIHGAAIATGPAGREVWRLRLPHDVGTTRAGLGPWALPTVGVEAVAGPGRAGRACVRAGRAGGHGRACGTGAPARMRASPATPSFASACTKQHAIALHRAEAKPQLRTHAASRRQRMCLVRHACQLESTGCMHIDRASQRAPMHAGWRRRQGLLRRACSCLTLLHRQCMTPPPAHRSCHGPLSPCGVGALAAVIASALHGMAWQARHGFKATAKASIPWQAGVALSCGRQPMGSLPLPDLGLLHWCKHRGQHDASQHGHRHAATQAARCMNGCHAVCHAVGRP